jgi:hypothetical protein
MELILNQIAPLLVQLLGAIALALASAALLKGRAWMDAKLSVEQRTFLAQLATTAVHLAEMEGIGKVGATKATEARNYVNGELAAAGVTTVKSADIEATVKGAVEAAFQAEIGPKLEGVPIPPAVVITSSGMTTAAPGPDIADIVITTEVPPAPVEAPPVVDAPTPTV